MRFHVIYGQGDITYYTTNYANVTADTLSAEYLLNQPKTVAFTWQLNDLPLTKKFVDCFIDTAFRGLKTNSLEYAYDVYQEPTEDLLLKSRIQMNNIIDKFNSTEGMWFNIPADLKLDEDDINNVNQDKLNTLHDLFENNLPILYQLRDENNLPSNLEFHNVYQDFQTINILVHYNEKIFQLVGKDRNECRENLKKLHKQYFTALKLVYHNPNLERFYRFDLEPEDYKHFTMHKPKGWLELDFATVGKDLVSCAWTNDVDLVRKNACSQQLNYYPWVSYGWTHYENDRLNRENIDNVYYKWLKDNQVEKYLDLSDPKYTPGRHILGQCISHDIENAEQFHRELLKTGTRILGVCITDDGNKDIL